MRRQYFGLPGQKVGLRLHELLRIFYASDFLAEVEHVRKGFFRQRESTLMDRRCLPIKAVASFSRKRKQRLNDSVALMQALFRDFLYPAHSDCRGLKSAFGMGWVQEVAEQS